MKKVFNPKLVRLIICTNLIIISVINIQCKKTNNSEITTIYTSSSDGDRLTKSNGDFTSSKEDLSFSEIIVDENTRFQKMDGFGATFNEAGMICLNSLSPSEQNEVLKMLFDPESGAGFTLMKSPIAACDFSSAGPYYSYNETPGDTAMTDFSIERDLLPNGLVTFIKKALPFGKFEIESPMDFAPDWMYYDIRNGQKQIKPEYYKALANYYLKYIKDYANNGIKINYLALFNESGSATYSDVSYKTIGKIVKEQVIPLFRANNLDTKILLGETNTREEGTRGFPPALEDFEVREYIHSFAVHGYDWNNFNSLSELHNKYPEIPIWMTEVCYVSNTLFPKGGPAKSPVYEFSDGEFWGNMIVNDLKNWVSGWIYWNMILDQNGGPWLVSEEHADPDPNQQHPVVIVDRSNLKVTYTGLYYYLAHFSKFVKPGAYRISCLGNIPSLNFVSFQNPDKSIVVNIINNSDELSCKVTWKDRSIIQKLKAHSITTVHWK